MMGGPPPAQGPLNRSNSSYINGFAPSNGLDHSKNGNRASWAGSQDSSSSLEGEKAIRPKYPHIKDLQEKAQEELRVSIDSSVGPIQPWTAQVVLSRAIVEFSQF